MKRNSSAAAVAFNAVVVALLVTVSARGQSIDIGSRLELFVDKALIARMDGVKLKMHRPVKAARPSSPLPERHMMTVIKDGGLFRAYWRGSDPNYTGRFYTGHPGETVHYAESRDGHEWEFPNLGMHEVDGTREDNVILARQPTFLTNFMPFFDTRHGVDPHARYRALAGHTGPGDKRVTFSGSELLLNFSTSAAGSLRVEIRTADGEPISGVVLADSTELFGDEIDRTYSWKSGTDVSSLVGKPVRLRFVMQDADLYSFRFTD